MAGKEVTCNDYYSCFGEIKKICFKIYDLIYFNQRKYAEMFSERVRELEGKLMDEEYCDFYEFSADLNTLRSDFERETPAKDSMAKKFFTEVSERLHRLAAEKVGAKKDREVQKQLRQSEVRLAARENELEVKKNEFERERIEQEGKASLLHSDIA